VSTQPISLVTSIGTDAPNRGNASRGPGREPLRRRAEDRVLPLLLAPQPGHDARFLPAAGNGSRLLQGYEVGPEPNVRVTESAEPMLEADDGAVLLELGSGDALLAAGAAIRRIPRGKGGEELLMRAAAGAAAWRRERLREWRQFRLAEQLITFSERLNSARTLTDVHEGLLQSAVSTVGAYTSFLVLTEENGRLAAVDHPSAPCEVRPFPVQSHPRLRRPGLIYAAEAQSDTGSPLAALAPLFARTRAAVLAHVPVAAGGVLFLVERRGERLFEPEDWSLLDVLVSQAEIAIERVELFERVRELSLTDPLTGLGNRRHMQVVLKHSLAAAQRGDALSVVMLDLDSFKAINDDYGHLEGDRVLRIVADCLREEIRGADLAVRFGGDEFLIILPGTDLPGAQSLIRRVEEKLEGHARISAGAAEYHPSMKSADDLIDRADRELYAVKRGKRGVPAG
jgi:diguanylate cyclase (GGDEF)-like protein